MSGPKLHVVLFVEDGVTGILGAPSFDEGVAKQDAASSNHAFAGRNGRNRVYRHVPYIPAKVDAATVERCVEALERLDRELPRVLSFDDMVPAVLRAAGLEVES